MKFNWQGAMLTASMVPLVLSGCGGGGGGGSSSPYDGTWQAVYSSLSTSSSITDTKTILCNNPPAPFTIDNLKGTVTISATCTTTIIDTSVTPNVSTTYPPQTTYAIAGITIEAKDNANGNDVMHAQVNGMPFTGECISTNSCNAVSASGESLGITR